MATQGKEVSPVAGVVGKCPECGKDVVESKSGFDCIDRSCGFRIFKTGKYGTHKMLAAGNVSLSAEIVKHLLNRERVVIEGLPKKNPAPDKPPTYSVDIFLEKHPESGRWYLNHDFPEFEYEMIDVVRILGIPPTINSRNRINIQCPYFNSAKGGRRDKRDGELSINCGTEQSYRCFAGSGKCSNCTRCNYGKGNKLHLYVLYRGGTLSSAHQEVTALLRGEKGAKFKKENLPPVKQSETKLVSSQSVDELNATYSALLDSLSLSKMHRDNLLKRGLPISVIEKNGYASIPMQGRESIAKDLYNMGYKVIGIPGFYETEKDGTPMFYTYLSGFYIPCRNLEGQIVGLQIRYDIERRIKPGMTKEELKELKKKRYLWLSTPRQNKGASAEAAYGAHFVGFEHGVVPETVIITEGPIKGDVSNHLIRELYNRNQPFVCIPGVKGFTCIRYVMKILKEMGVKHVIGAWDMDRFHNPYVGSDVLEIRRIICEEFGYAFCADTRKEWTGGNRYSELRWKYRWDAELEEVVENKGYDDFLLNIWKKKNLR